MNTSRTIPGAVEGTDIPVFDIDADVQDFATSDGRYFADAGVMLSQMHDLLHALLPEAASQGFDEQTFSDANHVLLNMTMESLGALTAHIGMMLLLDGLGNAEDPFAGVDIAGLLDRLGTDEPEQTDES